MEPQPNMGVSLLLVEDDPVLQELYLESFREAGVSVTQAFDGQQAIELLDSDAAFNVVFLDIMLPKVSGFDVLTHIRQTRGREFPVLLVTALADIDDQARGLQLGATEYLTKGDVPPSRVIELIKQHALRVSGPTP